VPDIKVKKQFGALPKLYGKVIIKKGSYYILNGKKLVLQKGFITFKGTTTNPNINIVMEYDGREYDIKIYISGTLNRPTIYFTSNPPLTKDQILAYLLFDDSSAAGTHSQESMVSLIGGALAKSFLGSLGIKIDHLSIKEDGFSIGKSLGKHVIIYYNQDGDKPSVKTRVDITKSIRTVIEIKEESQSVDIIFSKEY
jgi:translocation and assembly module TamB